jgi:hypothetical protein
MRLLLLNAGIVSEILTQNDYIIDTGLHPHDTLVLDDQSLFTVGETYTQEVFAARAFALLTPTEQLLQTRKNASMTKEQADYALIIEGLKDLAEAQVTKLGSPPLRAAWYRPQTNYTRLCVEVDIEMKALLGITDTQMDEGFSIGMSLDIKDLAGTATPAQYAIITKYEATTAATATFDQAIATLTANISMNEKVSFTKQETEARAWNADNLAVTPLIDGLLVSRGLGETKQILVDKIIVSADAYAVAYSQALGEYQTAIRNIG